MSQITEENFRKIARNFKGRVEMMNKTPLEKLEKLFIEYYDYGIKDFIRTEKKKFPHKTRKEVVIRLYELHDKLKGRKRDSE